LFRVAEMALDSVFNHLTQVTQRIGFGRNSVSQGGSNKTSIDRILCDLKDNFHRRIYRKLLYAVKGGLYRGPAAASLTNGQATSQCSISPMLNRFDNVPLNGEHVAAIPLPLVGSERSLAEDRKPARG
jgi:hypothetical protein